MTDKPVYYIKFNASKCHLDTLVSNGDLYMNCPQYYVFCHLYLKDPEIGDALEGAFLNGFIHKYSANLMFCLYSVFPWDVIRFQGYEAIKINNKAIELFTKKHKSFAVIDAERLRKHLKNVDHLIGDHTFGQVEYLEPSIELDTANLIDNSGKALLIKRPRFSYQQEARLILSETFGKSFCVAKQTEDAATLLIDGEEYHGAVRSIGSLAPFSCVLSTADMTMSDGAYFLKTEKICFKG